MKSVAVENAYVTVWIEDGILTILYKKDAIVGLQAAIEIVALCEKLAQGVAYPPLIYVKHLKIISSGAKKYFATKAVPNLRGAVIVDSGINKILGNMFLVLDKPFAPTKIFTDKEEAIRWIKKGVGVTALVE
jgi:hypothetical protein